jgi:hypothetical protein
MSDMIQCTLGETISAEAVLPSGLRQIEADPNQLEAQ